MTISTLNGAAAYNTININTDVIQSPIAASLNVAEPEFPTNITADTCAVLELSNEGITAASAVSNSTGIISKMAVYLKDLGFYDGNGSGVLTDGLKRSLECFQRAYDNCKGSSGFTKIGSYIPDSLVSWIEEVGTSYYTHLTDPDITSALSKLNFIPVTSDDKKHFAQIWTFLGKGMHCDKGQIAGIMGNIKQESSFRPTITSSKGAFGIFQWIRERRGYLEAYAQKNGYNVSSMGTQLAFFRYEVSSVWGKGDIDESAPNSDLVRNWNTLKNTVHGYGPVANYFMQNIEMASDPIGSRVPYAKIIYDAIL